MDRGLTARWSGGPTASKSRTLLQISQCFIFRYLQYLQDRWSPVSRALPPPSRGQASQPAANREPAGEKHRRLRRFLGSSNQALPSRCCGSDELWRFPLATSTPCACSQAELFQLRPDPHRGAGGKHVRRRSAGNGWDLIIRDEAGGSVSRRRTPPRLGPT